MSLTRHATHRHIHSFPTHALPISRKRIGAAIQPLLKKAKPDLLDEITYRAVAIGFPVFTLGGLIFAAIWAQIAWDRSEEHTSELQSRGHLVCRLLLEKKNMIVA